MRIAVFLQVATMFTAVARQSGRCALLGLAEFDRDGRSQTGSVPTAFADGRVRALLVLDLLLMVAIIADMVVKPFS